LGRRVEPDAMMGLLPSSGSFAEAAEQLAKDLG
jgi:hypothetical protein